VQSLADLERDWNVEEVQAMHELLDGLDWAEGESAKRANERGGG
jgi:hypothetical protein